MLVEIYIYIYVKVYRTGPCTGSLLHCHIGLPGLELYTHTASGKGRYNQHSTLHGSGAVIPTG